MDMMVKQNNALDGKQKDGAKTQCKEEEEDLVGSFSGGWFDWETGNHPARGVNKNIININE